MKPQILKRAISASQQCICLLLPTSGVTGVFSSVPACDNPLSFVSSHQKSVHNCLCPTGTWRWNQCDLPLKASLVAVEVPPTPCGLPALRQGVDVLTRWEVSSQEGEFHAGRLRLTQQRKKYVVVPVTRQCVRVSICEDFSLCMCQYMKNQQQGDFFGGFWWSTLQMSGVAVQRDGLRVTLLSWDFLPFSIWSSRPGQSCASLTHQHLWRAWLFPHFCSSIYLPPNGPDLKKKKSFFVDWDFVFLFIIISICPIIGCTLLLLWGPSI